MICPQCRLDKPTLSSAVVEGVYYSRRCNSCLAGVMQLQQPTREAKEYDRNRQRKDFKKDIIQGLLPNGKPNPEFLKAYPEQAHKRFTPDEIRNIERNIDN